MSIQREQENPNCRELAKKIKAWGQSLGFQQIGIADTDLNQAENHLFDWLNNGFHGEMQYMARHGAKRSRPSQLIPATTRIITARMNYLPVHLSGCEKTLCENGNAYVSRYALGRDYHKVLRKRLQKLSQKIEDEIGEYGYRVFVDSAPVLEKAIAEKAGLGWIGKHTNLISQQAGSWFFLGEIYTDLPLPADSPAENRCGTCQDCIDICPTQAIVAPYRLDARRCISYLTIELRGTIPEQFRSMIGNRIYGCDDCQLVCPWNRFAQLSSEIDFAPRNELDNTTLISLFSWSNSQFLKNTEGTSIRRIGYLCWLRNIAVALGNAPRSVSIIAALKSRENHESALVREHVAWALKRHKV